jgi:hypothetical protein
MWLPVFDYRYRTCIVVAFLSEPGTTQCALNDLFSSDFRTIFHWGQLVPRRSDYDRLNMVWI